MFLSFFFVLVNYYGCTILISGLRHFHHIFPLSVIDKVAIFLLSKSDTNALMNICMLKGSNSICLRVCVHFGLN
jgi:hypothetical protein